MRKKSLIQNTGPDPQVDPTCGQLCAAIALGIVVGM